MEPPATATAQAKRILDRTEQTRVYQEGRQEGRQEGEAAFALCLLSKRFETLDPALETRIQALSVPQLEALANSLLDFSELSDFLAWLDNNQ